MTKQEIEKYFNKPIAWVKIEMGCNHPDMQDNTTESVGCTGNCASYQYSVATCSIPEMLRLIELAGLVK